jgi:2-dehydro-3-deoxygalactonokinase
MITSSLGLREVPHIRPPAGIAELANAAQWNDFRALTPLPVLLVPGIRSGPEQVDLDSLQATDVMRGEETLCIGLVSLGLVKPPAVVMNLGSHWKAIQLDDQGRITSSVTSLSGELIHAVQSETILAGSIAKERPKRLDSSWLEAGMREQRASGLPRALFCARLLDLAKQGNADDRLGFIVGATIAADLDALRSREVIRENAIVALVGGTGIAQAWQYGLARNSITAIVISESDAEKALLSGLRAIVRESLRVSATPAVTKRQSSQ